MRYSETFLFFSDSRRLAPISTHFSLSSFFLSALRPTTMARKTPRFSVDFVTLKMPSKTSMSRSTLRSHPDHHDRVAASAAAVIVSIRAALAASMDSRASTVSTEDRIEQSSIVEQPSHHLPYTHTRTPPLRFQEEGRTSHASLARISRETNIKNI